MSFTDQQPRVATAEDCAAQWNCERDGLLFRCTRRREIAQQAARARHRKWAAEALRPTGGEAGGGERR